MQDLLIEAGRGERHYWRDLWRFRELFYFLAWRDILVRYKQTVIGVMWALIQPFLTMVVFTVIFGKVARLPTHGVPYPILVFAGLLPWQFFSQALGNASGSLIGSANLISKIYFPRLLLPAGAVVTCFIDFLIAGGLLAGLMVWYQFLPGWGVLALPLFIAMAFAAATGAGLWLAALTVKYRDFRYVVPFVIQLGLYISPVGFRSDVVPSHWRALYYLNPMAGVIDGFRWSLLGDPISVQYLLTSFAVVVVVLILGVRYFRRTERTFADVI